MFERCTHYKALLRKKSAVFVKTMEYFSKFEKSNLYMEYEDTWILLRGDMTQTALVFALAVPFLGSPE